MAVASAALFSNRAKFASNVSYTITLPGWQIVTVSTNRLQQCFARSPKFRSIQTLFGYDPAMYSMCGYLGSRVS